MNRSQPTLQRDKLRVLVIDDDDLAREFLCTVLRRSGFAVFDLPSTIGATVRITRDEIQVVVLDIMMPSIRGDKLATLLRKNSQLAELGVVLVSSCPRSELEQLELDVDADAVVGKDEARTKLADAVLAASRIRKTRTPPPP
jgi:DNA-binding response OmpR family regulator